MGYKSIRIDIKTPGNEAFDYRIAGKFVTFVIVNDVTKTTGFTQGENKIIFTNTYLNIGDIVVVNFEV